MLLAWESKMGKQVNNASFFGVGLPNISPPCHRDVSMATFSGAERLWNESGGFAWEEKNESSDVSAKDDGECNYYAMLYSLLILAIVFGNVLVCLAVLRERSLQTTTNYLVVSLAVADLLVASLVMPWAVYLEVSTWTPWFSSVIQKYYDGCALKSMVPRF